ncbi:MAG TPA: GH1 family beta-glucosidase [Ktedonobacteraceae bacterium]|nr:GH1 family beta-glucosidase [Ktedonobacteraceae bacterium]
MNDLTDTFGQSVEAASFPRSFLWGAATSSYQIEGATREDGRGASIWDRFSATPGKTYQGATGDIAVDHYHRMSDDVALMARLGLNAYRFSVAWPRVLPQGTGAVNEKGLDFYDRLVDALLEHKITPFATLYHWDLPLALEEKGGWLVRETAYAFADYAEIMAKRLGDRVIWWATHNEPFCTAYLGYGIGIHAPGIKNMQAAMTAGHHVLLSHALAVPRIRAAVRPDAQVGITLNFTLIDPADDSLETRECVRQEDTLNNRWFIEPIYRGSYPDHYFEERHTLPPAMEAGDSALIATPIDFLGVNYYTRYVIRARANGNGSNEAEIVVPVPGASYTEVEWEVYPDGLYKLLARLNREYAPKKMLVTENGAAFNDQWNGEDFVSDPQRTHYLRTHIQAVARAIRDGAPVQGYFVWSLMDNYEWAYGYSKRFGIVYIDYSTQQRIVKDSGRWYSSFLASMKR